MDFNIALPDDTLFQRAMAKRMRNRLPITVQMMHPELTYSGWISGLDDEWMQLCQVGNFDIVWIQRDQIASISEHTLAIELTEYQKEERDGYTHRMSEVARKALEQR
jgi:hypothetical protein